MTPDQYCQETTAKPSAAGSYVWTTEAGQLAEDYAREFRVSIDELRSWVAGAEDKPAVMDYLRKALEIEAAWRQRIADDYHARQAGALS